MKIEKNTVVTLQYKVSDINGKLIEEVKEPMAYLHGGYDNTLPKIEAALEGQDTGYQTVLQLQPETQQRSLRLTAEAKTREAMLRYVRRLGETRVLSGVHLVNHHVQVEDPSRPIQFGVQATFRGNR